MKNGDYTETVIQDNKNECDCKNCCSLDCGTKKRTVSVSSQIKMTHNKSEIGHKNKKCSLHRKEKNNSVKKSNVINNIAAPLTGHLFIKTF